MLANLLWFTNTPHSSIDAASTAETTDSDNNSVECKASNEESKEFKGFLKRGIFHTWLVNWAFCWPVSKISWWKMHRYAKYGTLKLAHMEELFLPTKIEVIEKTNKRVLHAEPVFIVFLPCVTNKTKCSTISKLRSMILAMMTMTRILGSSFKFQPLWKILIQLFWRILSIVLKLICLPQNEEVSWKCCKCRQGENPSQCVEIWKYDFPQWKNLGWWYQRESFDYLCYT